MNDYIPPSPRRQIIQRRKDIVEAMIREMDLTDPARITLEAAKYILLYQSLDELGRQVAERDRENVA